MNNLFSRKATTASGSRSAATKGGKPPVKKPEPNKSTLRVPNVFENGDPVFLMSATHRGDMYHFRAALQIENCSVILYDSNHTDATKPKTKDLEEYLAESVLKKGKHIFVVPWEYEVLSGKKPPPNKIIGCFLDRKEYNKQANDFKSVSLGTYSEKASTQIIASAPGGFKDVVNGMAILGDAMDGDKFPNFKQLSDALPKVSEDFEKLWAEWAKAGVKAGKNAILLMYRDTGTRDPAPIKTMGVYPELDNGDATEDIEKIVGEMVDKENKPLTIFTCGLKDSGIGEYWNNLRELKPKEATFTTRDFEAYFIKWSYENNYFGMATGFRSGPLDLFTFMGIPTVSIGLRNLMGEPRHQLLAEEKFSRVNIQYDQPRHRVTAAVTSSRWKTPPGPGQTTFGSPFWDDDFQSPKDAKGKRDIPQDKQKEQMQKPRRFAPFDRVVVETGYLIAFQKYMGWEQTVVVTMKNALPCTVTTSDARFCYPFRLLKDKTALGKYFDDNEKLDYGDVKRVERKLGEGSETLQLSKQMFDKYQDDYDNDWDKIPGFIKDKMVLGRQTNGSAKTWTRKYKIKK